MNMQPRMRGKAYQKGTKWHWTMTITFGEMSVDDPESLVIGDVETIYISKESAIKGMKKEVPRITKIIADTLGVKNDIKDYLDLTKGATLISESELLKQ